MTDRLDRLIAALDTLPTLPRIVFILSATDGMSHRAIALRLGKSVTEVEEILADAFYRLHRLLSTGEVPP